MFGNLALPFEKYLHIQLGITIFLIVSTFILLHFALKRRKYSKLIPCRNKWFIDIFGDLSCFCFNSKAYNGYPMTTIFLQYAEAFTQLYKREKLFSAWISYMQFVVLLSPEAIEEVLKSTTTIKKPWVYDWTHCWIGSGLLTSHGKKWKSRRKLLTPAFHFDILKDFMPIIQEKSEKLVNKFRDEVSKEFTDISTLVTLSSLDVICETTLGVNVKAQENSESEYVKAVERMTDNIMRRITSIFSWFDVTHFLTPNGRKMKKDIQLLHNFTMKVIKEKKKEKLLSLETSRRKRKPLIDVLLDHHLQTEELTEEDIREEVDTFAFEGHDTTASSMIWTLYLVGLYKDVQRNIQKELDFIFGADTDRPITIGDLKDMKYLECVIKESMRLYPPVPGMGREAEEDLNICGYPIPAGTPIVIIQYALHRNAEIYPDPEVFDPERFSPENSAKRHHFAYIPFSAGPRNCIGQKLAMMEIKTVLANILRSFHLESLDPRDKLLPAVEIILRPSAPVRIKVSARK